MDKHKLTKPKEVIKPTGFGIRHLQVGLWSYGLFSSYAGRVNLSVAIVAMLDNTKNPDFVSYDWDQFTKALVLSSFFWGYTISQALAGLLAHRFKPKISFLLASGFCSVTTFLIPFYVTTGGWERLCTVRVLQGIAQGFIFPSVQRLITKWIHPSEADALTLIAYCGTQVGIIVMLAVSGLIAASSIGWPGIFYISGGAQGLWVILWFLFGENSPADFKGISEGEKQYIESMPNYAKENKFTFPWKDVLSSKPILALIVVHCAQNWTFWLLLMEIPSYLNGVFNYGIKMNGLLSALPYFVMCSLSVVMGKISKYLINKRAAVTIGNGRKIFNSIAFYGPIVTLIALSFITKENRIFAIILLTITVGLNGGAFLGFLINHADLSPNFAGHLLSLTNCIANIFSVLGIMAVGWIVQDQTDQSLWNQIFFISSGFYFIGNTVFILYGEGTIQSWNESIKKK